MWAQTQRLSFSPSTRRISTRIACFLWSRSRPRSSVVRSSPRPRLPAAGRSSLPSSGSSTRSRRRRPEMASAISDAYRASGRGKLTGTTHISVVDGDGTAAALSSTLGSGSGVFRGGAQLNNMLGELDVIGHEPRAAGTRLPTMLTPTLVLEKNRPWLVLGSAGSVRLAGCDRAGRLARGCSLAADRGGHRRSSCARGGWASAPGGGGLRPRSRSSKRDWDVVRWGARNLYFGGVQAVELGADGVITAAGDPRRGGAGVVVP